MAQRSGRKIFVNLPVRDLERSKDFFAKLGFSFNPQFTDGHHWEVVWMDPAKVQEPADAGASA